MQTPSEIRSPRAYALYRHLVAEANAEPLKFCTEVHLTDAELRWCELTPLESWVFGIEPALHNALTLAYARYLAMIGVCAEDFGEVAEEDRDAFPDCFCGPCVFSFDRAVGFMVEACDMPYDQALVWVARALVQNVRSGLYNRAGDPPFWAVGSVEAGGETKGPGSFVLVYDEDLRP